MISYEESSDTTQFFSGTSPNIHSIFNVRKWLVPYFGCQFWPIFWQAEEEFFAMTVRSLCDENSSNKFYIRISVVVISYFSLFGDLISSLINVYGIWWALSSVFWFEQKMFLGYVYIYLPIFIISI